MTDRIRSLTVALEKDTRDDDAEKLIEAIRCLRNVAGVTRHPVTPNDFAVETRVRNQLLDSLIATITKGDK